MNLIKAYKNKLLIGMILFFLFLMLLYPGATYRGASSGLLLWFHHVLPNILPFIIISNILIRLNVTAQISRVLYPILGKLFRISNEACYPIIFGLLSGIPMGAKATADMVSEHRITKKEGAFIIGICNNVSPMFILGYISITQLKLPQIKYPLFVIIYTASILGPVCFRIFDNIKSKKSSKSQTDIVTVSSIPNTATNRFSFNLVDSSIMNGFEIVTRIGGYIILFSILSQILKEFGSDSGLVKAILIGILEITTGVSQICNTNISMQIKIVLVATLTTFSGLSGIAQTKSVLQDSRLSIRSYIIVKLISAVIALLLSYLYVSRFFIV